MRDRDLNEASAVSLVIFDCDGVLVDSEILAMRAYQDVLAQIGVAAPPYLWAQCVGLKQADIFAQIEAVVGRTIPAHVRDELGPRTRSLFEADLLATPGLTEFLESLSLRRCVASSSDPGRIRSSLALTDLARFFGDDIFSAHSVVHGKPAPDLFLHAASRMGVEPAAALVVEDSLPGVRGAKAAHMRVIGYLGGSHVGPDHGERLLEAGADALAENWADVNRWLARGS
jgi:HAD superfamily hydrolase (TIGR01509 family)